MKKMIFFSLLIAVISITTLNIQSKEIYVDEIDQGEYTGGNGFIEGFNPKLREGIYNGYDRDGEFKLFNYETNQLLNADHISVRNGIYYFRVNGSEFQFDRKDENQEKMELTSTQGKMFHVGEVMKVYREPFYDESLLLPQEVSIGDYETLKRSYQFVQIVLPDGTSGWVSAGYRDTFFSEGYYKTQSYFIDTPSELSVKEVNGVPIKTMMIPRIHESVRSKIPSVPLYVTIHNTANEANGAGAKSHAEYQKNHLNTWTSWHFSVDNKEIYQSIPMNEIAYHAGDGSFLGNGATVAIEICENVDGNYAQAEKNAAYLTAHILFENGLPSDAIRMHRNWSGKTCPKNMINGTKGTMGWSAFQKLVATEYQRLVDENKPEEPEIPEMIPEVDAFLQKAGLSVKDGTISGLKHNLTIQQALDRLNQVEEGVSVSIQNTDHTQTNEDVLATGMNLTVTIGEVSQTLNLAILGDVSGDGKISSMDYALVKNQILKITSLSTAQKVAANINHDEKISSMDYAMIKNHILGISLIEEEN